MALPVYLETGSRKVFACSLDWPGWCRSGAGEEAALEALAAYASRYAVVAEEAGVRFPARAGSVSSFEVVERLPGGSGTDFGVPGAIATADASPMTKREAERQTALVVAAWAVLDRVLAGAPASLRKGPRGGGRDRDKIAAHVVESEAAYARLIGLRPKAPAFDDVDAVATMRAEIAAVLRSARSGEPLRETGKGWPARYAARRIAWHALDHAWEIEDRST